MVSLMFIILASICNAIMDKITHHWDRSIFSNGRVDNQFWNPEVSWKNKYVADSFYTERTKWFWGITKPVQITDAWHFLKMLMIIFICASIITFIPTYLTIISGYTTINYLVGLLIYGTAWNLTFSLFYNKLLEKKNK